MAKKTEYIDLPYDLMLIRGQKDELLLAKEAGVQEATETIIMNLIKNTAFSVTEIARFTEVPESKVKEIVKGTIRITFL